MYLKYNIKISKNALLDVPHKPEPMTVTEIKKELPEFAKQMDGQCQENCLDFYYKKNKQTDVYEFIDQDSEEDIAEIMGVEIGCFDTEEKTVASIALDAQQMEMHKENLEMIREGLAAIR